jgi:hypothetical protein
MPRCSYQINSIVAQFEGNPVSKLRFERNPQLNGIAVTEANLFPS